MSRKYPCLDHIEKKPNWKDISCVACNEQATRLVWVQYSYMRGEDESFKACHIHADMARNDTMKFLRLCESKLEAK